jgi:PAS domain S-box-containing protein
MERKKLLMSSWRNGIKNGLTEAYSSLYRLILDPFSSVQGAYNKRQSRFLTGLLFSIFFMGAVNEIFYTIQEYARGYRGYYFVACALVIVFASYLLARTRFYSVIAGIFVMLFSGSIYYLAFANGTHISIWSLTYLVLPILMMGYFLPLSVMAILLPVIILPDGILLWMNVEAQTEENSGILVVLAVAAIFSMLFTRHRLLLEQESMVEKLAMVDRFHYENQQLLDTITSIMVRLDSNNCILYWNQPAVDFFGIAEKDALSKDVFTIPVDWDINSLNSTIVRCRVMRKKIRLPEVTVKVAKGKRILGVTAHPIKEAGAENIDVLLYGSDITDKLIITQQLEQQNKLESIGQLAAGVAHEINTPAQFIANNLRFLRDQFDTLQSAMPQRTMDEQSTPAQKKLNILRDEFPKAIVQSLDGIDRITGIVTALRNFSHPGAPKISSANLNEGLKSTIEVSRNEWKYVADLDVLLDPKLPNVDCYPLEINQVFLNILINAVHAIRENQKEKGPEKGKITIATSHAEDWVEVRISDTGSGIPKEVQSRIFDPFFTTKEIGQGTGQGLTISHNIIVQKHHGTLHFETEIGRGTTFIIRLPIISGPEDDIDE